MGRKVQGIPKEKPSILTEEGVSVVKAAEKAAVFTTGEAIADHAI